MLRLSSPLSLGNIAVTAAVTAAVLGTFAAAPAITHACGGCFAPTGQPSVVTAHRMVVSVSNEQTTLWDQFEYAGDPDDFVWVLPVAGGEDVQIGVAEQSFFQYLSDRTQVSLRGPVSSTGGGSGLGCGASASGEYGPSGMATNVTIYSEAVVGPYETVTIGADDADSLTGWLTANDYTVPDALLPTIDHYIAQDMDFVVLRLSPNAGVSQMQPVRVTTPGVNVSFPLRMVAAGIGDTVALELYLIAEGRWEAQNFPNAEIFGEQLTYDWATGSFDYDEVADGLLAEEGGRTWLTEYSSTVYPPSGNQYVTYSDGAYHGPQADWDIATQDLPAAATVTRMRAELPASALAEDLILQASLLGPRPTQLNVENQINASVSQVPGRPESNGTPGALLFAAAFAVAFVLRPKSLRRLAS